MTLPYQDPNLPIANRVADLLSRLTISEKIGRMTYQSLPIPRLEIPAYNWWNECLHGVARAGLATVFPQAIGLAATWNTSLMHRVATAISDEARAKHHQAVREGRYEQYFGLTFWSPNINLFRDPRWGRGQETYGEDPYLTAEMGVAFVRGLQGDDPIYRKVIATPKHFAVHSGPEQGRHGFNAVVMERDLWNSYLYAFSACVQAGAGSVMGAYNRVNGEPACASPTLLQRILREKWGFEGYVVSDCGAITDIYEHHKSADTLAEAAALALKNGCDLDCGKAFAALPEAFARGYIDESDLDRAVSRLFSAQMSLGMFDPPERVPYAQIPIEVVDSAEHRALALQASRESIVLLKNDGILPLNPAQTQTIAVIGPNADDYWVLLGNYHGEPSQYSTPLMGLRQAVAPNITILSARGCDIQQPDQSGFAEAMAVAQSADIILFCGGLNQQLEGEEGEALAWVVAGEKTYGDRSHLTLPDVQQRLLEQLHQTGKPIILLLLHGGALAIEWAQENVAAILTAWYGGQACGQAVADVLLGTYNPAGRLPITVYRGLEQLPPFEEYDMRGRTYRYFTGDPLYTFGYGLSYSRFGYDGLRYPARASRDEVVTISADVTNLSERAGEEVVQLYLSHAPFIYPAPIRQLVGFQRIALLPHETRTVTFQLAMRDVGLWNDVGEREISAEMVQITLGGGQPKEGIPHQTGTILLGESQGMSSQNQVR